jgi:protocatechuate 3,4-dioxygenase beta subunit
MRNTLISLLVITLASACNAQNQREPIVGLPCEGCEAVFDGQPSQLASRARIAPASEPGEPMTIEGRVFDAQKRPRAGIVIYAYQTDRNGIYPVSSTVRAPETRRQGALRAWVKTDTNGRYAFDTLRPGSYPKSDVPEHVHLHVLEPGCATYYIDDIMFRDDPKLTDLQIRRIAKNRGGDGIVTPLRRDGIWLVTRDIYLGKHIPGYQSCGSTRWVGSPLPAKRGSNETPW